MQNTSVRSASGGIDDVRAAGGLRRGNFLGFGGVVPRFWRRAGVRLDRGAGWASGFDASFVTRIELANQWNVHAADKSDDAGARGLACDVSHEKAAFVFAEDRADGVVTGWHAVNHSEFGVLELGSGFGNAGFVSEADTDDEVKAALGEVADALTDLARVGWLEVFDLDAEGFGGSSCALKGALVEAAVVLAARVECDTDADRLLR